MSFWQMISAYCLGILIVCGIGVYSDDEYCKHPRDISTVTFGGQITLQEDGFCVILVCQYLSTGLSVGARRRKREAIDVDEYIVGLFSRSDDSEMESDEAIALEPYAAPYYMPPVTDSDESDDGGPYLYVAEMQCLYNGQCIADGQSIAVPDCLTVSCSVSNTAGELTTAASFYPECLYDGQCMAPDSSLDISECRRVTCSQTGQITANIDTKSVSCLSHDGTCLDVGTDWEVQENSVCDYYTCALDQYDNATAEIINTDCEYSGSCLAVNSSVEIGSCSRVWCHYYEPDYIIDQEIYSCQVASGNCLAIAATWVVHEESVCNYYTCETDENGDAISQITDTACRSSDRVCHDVGTTWVKKSGSRNGGVCETYQCTLEVGVYIQIIINTECRITNLCVAVNDSLYVVRWAGCSTTTCTYDEFADQYVVEIDDLQCTDAYDNCLPIGSYPFHKYSRGILYENVGCRLRNGKLIYFIYRAP